MGEKTEQRYKAMLPSCLEQKIFKFVHFTLGHLGFDMHAGDQDKVRGEFNKKQNKQRLHTQTDELERHA
jgi:hypothetical protein